MSTLEATHGFQVHQTKIRLLVTRLFGLSMLCLVTFGSSYWSTVPLLDQALFSGGLVLAILGFCGRLWCLGYIAGRKKRVLVTLGPYSLCRHPLYFFSFIGGIGLGLCTETLSIAVLFVLAFALYYPAIIRTEESFLRLNFPDYESYEKRTPLFFPSWAHFADGEIMVKGCVFRNEIFAAGGFLSLVAVFEFIEALHHADVLPTLFLIP
jgi:protein-S-isoprenylcysteine O-methyltransferase Ste14